VAEAGVIGVPDETAGEIVKAYVTLNPGFEPGEDLGVRSAAMPARSSVPPSPRARSCSATTCPRPAAARSCAGLLKARELGLPEGDISTLETDET
jgi:acetyl-CoA synthetase